MISKDAEKDRKFSKAKKLRNSRLLQKYKSSNYPEVMAVVDQLFDEMVSIYRFELTRQSSVKKLKHHIEVFVLNLFKAYCNDPTKVIAYSRNRSAYSKKKSIYRKLGLSFRYSLDEGKDGKPVVGFLERQGYIETFSFRHDEHNPAKSFQSRMRATPKLIDFVLAHSVSDDMLDEDTSMDELIVVKGLKPKPFWVSVIKDGKKVRKRIQPKRKICKTPDNPKVREMRQNLELINSVMEKAEITLDVTEEELRELNARLQDDPDPYKQIIDFSNKRLHRSFLDRRLDRGGRFFGPWYQNIPKEYRQRIMINGAPTLELDYSALHPNLLYWYAKVDPPAGDQYALEGYSGDTREFLKKSFLKIINSKDWNEAKGSIREAAFYEKNEKKRLKIPEELGNLEDRYLDPLLDKFLKKHKPLEGFIFKLKNLGNILQCVDSMIAEKVLLYFAHKGIPVLPLHDSFRIDARAYDKLEEVMNRVIITNFGRPIRISNKDLVPLFDRLLGMIDNQIEEGAFDQEAFTSLVEGLSESANRIKLNLKKLEELKEKRNDS